MILSLGLAPRFLGIDAWSTWISKGFLEITGFLYASLSAFERNPNLEIRARTGGLGLRGLGILREGCYVLEDVVQAFFWIIRMD
jgi:hypothetical protein